MARIRVEVIENQTLICESVAALLALSLRARGRWNVQPDQHRAAHVDAPAHSDQFADPYHHSHRYPHCYRNTHAQSHGHQRRGRVDPIWDQDPLRVRAGDAR